MRNTIEWGKSKFHEHRRAVVYLDVVGKDEERGVGTAFHIGNGVFITARHVIEEKEILDICIDNGHDPLTWEKETEITRLEKISGPFFHENNHVDLACFVVKNPPVEYFKLGAHLDCFLGNYELLLHKTLVFGFPIVPFSKRPHLIVSTGEINGLQERPHLIVSTGEINGLLEKYIDEQLAFVISTMARGGFSGGPVLVAYNEENTINGTALLGVVTESLIKNNEITESGFMAVTTIQPIYDLLEQHNLLPDYQKLELE